MSAAFQLGYQKGIQYGWCSKNDRKALLTAAGLAVCSQTVEEFKRGFVSGASELQKRRDNEERERIAPFLSDAREQCAFELEDSAGDADAMARIEAKIVQWATAEADREDEEERQEQLQREADEAAYQKWLAVRGAMDCLQTAIESAIGADFRTSGGGSRYADFRGLKLRIADHDQVAGGGFDMETQERLGEADINWTVDEETDIPTREEIRREVAHALRRSLSSPLEEAE
jgi:hypothetical protein